MLVLSRKVNEGIRIGQDIKLVVVEIRGDKVRLGIEAPLEIPVHRDEVFAAIERAGTAEIPYLVPHLPSDDEGVHSNRHIAAELVANLANGGPGL